MPDPGVIVVTRFIVPDSEAADFLHGARQFIAALEQRPGHVSSRTARALDDADRWLVISEWVGVGAWRRALSAYEVRLEAVPFMARAEAEPSVYETVSPEAAG